MRVLLRLGQALAALDAPEEAMAEVDETLFDRPALIVEAAAAALVATVLHNKAVN